MLSEIGNLFLALALGFTCIQIGASFWTTLNVRLFSPPRLLCHFTPRHAYPEESWESARTTTSKLKLKSWDGKMYSRLNIMSMMLGRIATFLQGGFLWAAFLTLIVAFLTCDFSLLIVALHDHTYLPWYYRFAATWGNHEGSLLLFIVILSSMGVAQGVFIHNQPIRARTLTIQGLLTFLFLLFLFITSNPFALLPFTPFEGKSLNPLLQDRGLLIHPPLLYLGYVGFSAVFSLAIAALWGRENIKDWAHLVRPWALFAWGMLTAGIALGSWWAYYELGWGGWWFWDPVENASLMPWLTGTALLHTLRSGTLYRWALFLSLLTFSLSLLGTFLVRSGLITSVHSFAQDPDRGLFILSLLGVIVGFAFFMWIWKAPGLESSPLQLLSNQGTLLLNSLLLCVGLFTLLLGTLYPLWASFTGRGTIAVGAPYFERTFIPLMLPLLILIPFGSLLREKGPPLFSLLLPPLTIALGGAVFLLYILHPPSLWAFTGIIVAVWVAGGTAVAYVNRRLSWGASLAHLGVAISLLGVSVGGGFRTDETRILRLQESFKVGNKTLIFSKVQQGATPTYLYERAILTYPGGMLTPEKRLYLPQNSLLSETAIYTNGIKDIYVILGPYQGDNKWLIRASSIPLAPWIWIGAALIVCGAFFSFMASMKLKIPILVKRLHSSINEKNTVISNDTKQSKKQHSSIRVNRGLKGCLVLFLFFIPFSSFAEKALEKRANALYQEVRCPVCLGQSLMDSETEESKSLKVFILEKLKEGDSEETIREKLRFLLGEGILFRPPFESHTFFLWLSPFGLFAFILLGVLWKGFRS